MKTCTCGTTEYTMEVVDGVICLVDLDKGMSITNNAENIIAQLNNDYDLTKYPVIYCDTEDNWDWLTTNLQGNFSGFRHIGDCQSRDDSIREVKRLAAILI